MLCCVGPAQAQRAARALDALLCADFSTALVRLVVAFLETQQADLLLPGAEDSFGKLLRIHALRENGPRTGWSEQLWQQVRFIIYSLTSTASVVSVCGGHARIW